MTERRASGRATAAADASAPQLRCDGGEPSEASRATSERSAGPGEASGRSLRDVFDPEELRRRNASAVAIDLLYLFATAFLTTLFVRGFWPAVFAAVPLALLVYFAWRSTTAFLVAQAIVIVATVIATYAGVLPL